MHKTITIDLEPWMPSPLSSVTGGINPDQMIVYTAGRQTGKSMYMKMLKNRMYDSNRCKEITLMAQSILKEFTIKWDKPVSKYRFSRKWFTVEQSWFSDDWTEQVEWCIDSFGPEPKRSDAWCRWYSHIGGINFRDEKDYNWFTMMWGSHGDN